MLDPAIPFNTYAYVLLQRLRSFTSISNELKLSNLSLTHARSCKDLRRTALKMLNLTLARPCNTFAKIISSGVPHGQCHCAWRRRSGDLNSCFSLFFCHFSLLIPLFQSITQELLSPTESDNEDLLPTLSSSAPIGEVNNNTI